MTNTEAIEWINKNSVSNPIYEFYNKIKYCLCELQDGWIAIFEINELNGEYIPLIQAYNMNKAIEYCQLREPIPVPVEFI